MNEEADVSSNEGVGTPHAIAVTGDGRHGDSLGDPAEVQCAIRAASLRGVECIRQVAPMSWEVTSAPTAKEEAELVELVHAQGGVFLISRNIYIDVRRVCRSKAQFERRMAMLRDLRSASERAASANQAGWQLAEYVLELARSDDETCFDLLSPDPKVLQDVQVRQAFVHGFSISVESRYAEDEERFPTGQYAKAAQQIRTAFIARLREHLDLLCGVHIDQRRSTVDRVSEQFANEWAQDWFAGAAYCPLCKTDDLLAITSSSSDDASMIETWTCGCGHSWKIEFQETAATANADAVPAEWIERNGIHATHADENPRALSGESRTSITAAIARLCDASYACGEWTLDSDKSWAEVYREGVEARVALTALCARTLQHTHVHT